MIEKTINWPRWVQYGLLSGVATFLILLGQYTDFSILSGIGFGPIAPLALITDLGSLHFPLPLPELIAVVGFWSLLGALLGVITRKFVRAALIWLTAQILGGLLLIIYLMALHSYS